MPWPCGSHSRGPGCWQCSALTALPSSPVLSRGGGGGFTGSPGTASVTLVSVLLEGCPHPKETLACLRGHWPAGAAHPRREDPGRSPSFHIACKCGGPPEVHMHPSQVPRPEAWGCSPDLLSPSPEPAVPLPGFRLVGGRLIVCRVPVTTLRQARVLSTAAPTKPVVFCLPVRA